MGWEGSIGPTGPMRPIGKAEGRKKQKTTVLSLSDGRDSGNQTNRGPATRPSRFFDIYIQNSNNNFLELSLKFGPASKRGQREFQLSQFPAALKRP